MMKLAFIRQDIERGARGQAIGGGLWSRTHSSRYEANLGP